MTVQTAQTYGTRHSLDRNLIGLDANLGNGSTGDIVAGYLDPAVRQFFSDGQRERRRLAITRSNTSPAAIATAKPTTTQNSGVTRATYWITLRSARSIFYSITDRAYGSDRRV